MSAARLAEACRRPDPCFALGPLLVGATLCSCSGEPRAEHEVSASRALATLRTHQEGAPLWLSELGLYTGMERRELAPDLHEVTPAFPLWSDGAAKRRWMRLPPGSAIDSSAMDDWQFPPGSMLFKEFSTGGRRMETRLIARTGAGARDYWMGAFVWDEAESDARFAPEGALDVHGTSHDVPRATSCGTCHNGEPGRVLGISAVQTPHLDGDLLSHPAPDPGFERFEPIARAALGYLHGNCAHCHNPQGSARPDTDMDLRLATGDMNPAETAAAGTTIERPLQRFGAPELSVRVAPGAPERSALLARMLERGTPAQMPPLASEHIDPGGIAAVREWIAALEPQIAAPSP